MCSVSASPRIPSRTILDSFVLKVGGVRTRLLNQPLSLHSHYNWRYCETLPAQLAYKILWSCLLSSRGRGFCKYCVLFSNPDPSVKELGVLVTRPLHNFKKATEIMNDHFYGSRKKGRKSHQVAFEKALKNFISVFENQSLSIASQLSMERDRQIEENRLKLISIVETILFLGRQGIANRGHREGTALVLENTENNQGNFLALLKFRVQSGDRALEQHLTSVSSNALYTSKTIQNELITICGDLIRRHILSDIQRAGFYSVIADEATDVANQEQLAISIRSLVIPTFVKNSLPSINVIQVLLVML